MNNQRYPRVLWQGKCASLSHIECRLVIQRSDDNNDVRHLKAEYSNGVDAMGVPLWLSLTDSVSKVAIYCKYIFEVENG